MKRNTDFQFCMYIHMYIHTQIYCYGEIYSTCYNLCKRSTLAWITLKFQSLLVIKALHNHVYIHWNMDTFSAPRLRLSWLVHIRSNSGELPEWSNDRYNQNSFWICNALDLLSKYVCLHIHNFKLFISSKL